LLISVEQLDSKDLDRQGCTLKEKSIEDLFVLAYFALDIEPAFILFAASPGFA